MEQRIETRVSKIVLQKEAMMKQEKALILGKYDRYEKKIKEQRKQLGEAFQLIKKYQHISNKEPGDSYQTTMKLLNSEKSLDNLKIFYQNLASSKEVLKRDKVVLEKKVIRQQHKLKDYE